VGYASIYDDRPEHPSHPLVPATWSEFGSGDGAQVATARDMTAYLRLLLNRGGGPSGQVISRKSFDLITTDAVWTGGDYYGYGLAMYEVDGRTYIGHGGGSTGFRAALVVDMEAGP
jgi:CubicO group peptidase (beta-lactamase class C family)